MNKLIICGFSCCCALTWAADPTAPDAVLTVPVALESPLPQLSLIRMQGQQLLAILDGVAVKAGQQHQGYLVRQINARTVVLERGSQQWTLQLFGTAAQVIADKDN